MEVGSSGSASASGMKRWPRRASGRPLATPLARSDFQFFHRIRIRWSEVDRQGVVFNGHHLTYFDVGMTEYLREIGYPYPQGLIEGGTDLHLVKAVIEYKGFIRFDELIDVATKVGRFGRSSLTFDFEIFRKDEDAVLASGQNIYVNVGIETKKSAPLPEELVRRIRKMEGADSEA
jgi:acyl-CoA thioester hydrolase